MFFETWGQGLLFGIVTTVGMLAISYPFALMWKKYEDPVKKSSCDNHSH